MLYPIEYEKGTSLFADSSAQGPALRDEVLPYYEADPPPSETEETRLALAGATQTKGTLFAHDTPSFANNNAPPPLLEESGDDIEAEEEPTDTFAFEEVPREPYDRLLQVLAARKDSPEQEREAPPAQTAPTLDVSQPERGNTLYPPEQFTPRSLDADRDQKNGRALFDEQEGGAKIALSLLDWLYIAEDPSAYDPDPHRESRVSDDPRRFDHETFYNQPYEHDPIGAGEEASKDEQVNAPFLDYETTEIGALRDTGEASTSFLDASQSVETIAVSTTQARPLFDTIRERDPGDQPRSLTPAPAPAARENNALSLFPLQSLYDKEPHPDGILWEPNRPKTLPLGAVLGFETAVAPLGPAGTTSQFEKNEISWQTLHALSQQPLLVAIRNKKELVRIDPTLDEAALTQSQDGTQVRLRPEDLLVTAPALEAVEEYLFLTTVQHNPPASQGFQYAWRKDDILVLARLRSTSAAPKLALFRLRPSLRSKEIEIHAFAWPFAQPACLGTDLWGRLYISMRQGGSFDLFHLSLTPSNQLKAKALGLTPQTFSTPVPWTGLFCFSPDHHLHLIVNATRKDKSKVADLYRCSAFSSFSQALRFGKREKLTPLWRTDAHIARLQFAGNLKILLRLANEAGLHQAMLDEVLDDEESYFDMPYWKQKLYQLLPGYDSARYDPKRKINLNMIGHYGRRKAVDYETEHSALTISASSTGAYQDFDVLDRRHSFDQHHSLGYQGYTFFTREKGSDFRDQYQGPKIPLKPSKKNPTGEKETILTDVFTRFQIQANNKNTKPGSTQYPKAFSFPYKGARHGHRYLTFYVGRVPTYVNRIELYGYNKDFNPQKSPLFGKEVTKQMTKAFCIEASEFPEQLKFTDDPKAQDPLDTPGRYQEIAKVKGEFEILPNAKPGEPLYRIVLQGFQAKARYIRVRLDLPENELLLDVEGDQTFRIDDPKTEASSIAKLGRAFLDPGKLLRLESFFAPRLFSLDQDKSPGRQPSLPLQLQIQRPPRITGSTTLLLEYRHLHDPNRVPAKSIRLPLTRGGLITYDLALKEAGHYAITATLLYRSDPRSKEMMVCDQKEIRIQALRQMIRNPTLNQLKDPTVNKAGTSFLFDDFSKGFKVKSGGYKTHTLDMYGDVSGKATLSRATELVPSQGEKPSSILAYQLFGGDWSKSIPEGYYALSLGLIGDQTQAQCSVMALSATLPKGSTKETRRFFPFPKVMGFKLPQPGTMEIQAAQWWRSHLTNSYPSQRLPQNKLGERFLGVFDLSAKAIDKNKDEISLEVWGKIRAFHELRALEIWLRTSQPDTKIAYIHLYRLSGAPVSRKDTILEPQVKQFNTKSGKFEPLPFSTSQQSKKGVNSEEKMAISYSQTIDAVRVSEQSWEANASKRDGTQHIDTGYSDRLIRFNNDGYSFSAPLSPGGKVSDPAALSTALPVQLASLYDKENLYRNERLGINIDIRRRKVSPKNNFNATGTRMQSCESLELDLAGTYAHITDLNPTAQPRGPYTLMGQGYVYATRVGQPQLISTHQASAAKDRSYAYLEIDQEKDAQVLGRRIFVQSIKEDKANKRFLMTLALRDRKGIEKDIIFSQLPFELSSTQPNPQFRGYHFQGQLSQKGTSQLRLRAWLFAEIKKPATPPQIQHVAYWRAIPLDVLDRIRWFKYIPVEKETGKNITNRLPTKICGGNCKTKTSTDLSNDPVCYLAKCGKGYPDNFDKYALARLSPLGKTEQEAEAHRAEDYIQALAPAYLHHQFQQRTKNKDLIRDIIASQPQHPLRLSLRMGQVGNAWYKPPKTAQASTTLPTGLLQGIGTYQNGRYYWQHQHMRIQHAQAGGTTTLGAEGIGHSYAFLDHQDYLIELLLHAVKAGVRHINLDFSRVPASFGNAEAPLLALFEKGMNTAHYIEEGRYKLKVGPGGPLSQNPFGTLSFQEPPKIDAEEIRKRKPGVAAEVEANAASIERQALQFKSQILQRFLLRLWITLQQEAKNDTVHLSLCAGYHLGQNKHVFSLDLKALYALRRDATKWLHPDLCVHTKGFLESIECWQYINRASYDPFQVRFLYEANPTLAHFQQAAGPSAMEQWIRLRPGTEATDRNPFSKEKQVPLIFPDQIWQRRLYDLLRQGGAGLNPFTVTAYKFCQEDDPRLRLLFKLSSRLGLELWQRLEAPTYDWWTELM